MFEVIEHLSDPVAVLRSIRDLLVPSGLLAIATPNFEGPGVKTEVPANKWFAPPAHVSYFGPCTLSRCVSQAGFEILALEGLLGDAEMPVPAPIAAVLRPFRHGKRLRPRGLLGRLIKAYQLRRSDALYWMDTLELYARRID